MCAFVLVCLFNFVGLVYILVEAYVNDPTDKFRHTIKWLTGFIVMQALTNGASMVLAIRLISDIGNGLRDVVAPKNVERTVTGRFEVE
jgi:hypothetical protein